MSIEDAEGNTIVRLSTVHEWAFKIAIWLAPIITIWFAATILRHDREIAVLQAQMAARGALAQAAAAAATGGERRPPAGPMPNHQALLITPP